VKQLRDVRMDRYGIRTLMEIDEVPIKFEIVAPPTAMQNPRCMLPPKDHPLRALRTVALFEAAKGLVVFGAGFGMLALLHHDLRHLAEALVGTLHLDPDGHRVGLFLAAADKLTDARLWMLSGLAFAYASLHVVEAWGLWLGRTWAKWLGVAAGAIYMPVEIYELWHRASLAKVVVLLLNVAVVVYLARTLRHPPAAA
jgi:uncharacterized membrane protein (DUF2068 family)